MLGRLSGDGVAEWRAGWRVVLAGAMGMALSTAHVYSTGIFIAPLEQEFGWSRTAVSSGMTIVAVVGVTSAPFVGLAIDRLGPRRIGLLGAVVFLSVLAAFSAATPSIWSWWALWSLMAVAATGIKPTVWTAAVSSLFVRSRGLALSVMLCGTGIGSSLTPVLCNHLIREYGWRTAYLGLAGFWAVLVLPILFLFLTSAHDRRRAAGPKAPVPVTRQGGMTVREGLRSPQFLKLGAGAFLVSLVAVSFVVNMVPILVSTGLSRDRAAEIAGIVGVMSIVGRLAAGVMLDHWDGNRIAGVSVALPIAAAGLLLVAPGNIAVAVAAAVVIGLCLGSELDAVAYLSSRHFGMRSFGVLFGTIAGLLALSTGVGPLLVSYAYDVSGSYWAVLWIYMPLSVMASMLFLTLGPYPDEWPVESAEG